MIFETISSYHSSVFLAEMSRMQAVENIFGNVYIPKLGFTILFNSQAPVKALDNDVTDFKTIFSYLCSVLQAVENIFGKGDISKLGFTILSNSQATIKELDYDVMNFKTMYSYPCSVFQVEVSRIQAVENIFVNVDILQLAFTILSQAAIKTLDYYVIDFMTMYSYRR